MRTDPVQEWRRLTEHYRRLNEGELRQLAGDFDNLTETAQQALRNEFRSRGLGDPLTVPSVQRSYAAQKFAFAQSSSDGPGANPPAHSADAPDVAAESESTAERDAEPHDYTWFTYLCECETDEQAAQLCEVLRRAKIDCGYQSDGLVYPRVLAAADQLDQARDLAAKPIPQNLVDEFKLEVPEFVTPHCPRCGAGDPALVDIDPHNVWHCGQCQNEWVEARLATPAPNAAEMPL